MTFDQLVTHYYNSPDFMRLGDNSKSMYKVYIDRLAKLGAGLPLTDRAMQDHVARSRTRSPQFKGNLTTFWWNAINHYEMENGNKATSSTKNTLHTYLKVVYRYAITTAGIDVNEPDNPTVFKRWASKASPVIPLQLEEIAAIKKSLQDPTYPEDVKAYAMFWLAMFNLGVRPMDMYDHLNTWFFKKGDVEYYEVWGAKGKIKGALTRYVKLDASDLEILEWFKAQPVWPGHEKYTFRTSRGKKFQQSTYMGEKIKMVCTLAGIPPREIYEARRGLVGSLYKAGMEFKRIKDKVGHINERTTHRYGRLSLLEQADTYDKPEVFKTHG